MYVLSFLTGVLCGLALAMLLVYAGALSVPDRWNPWAPLEVTDPLNIVTRYKLARMQADPAMCLDALARTPMRYTPLPDRQTGEGCGFRNALRLEGTIVGAVEPFSLSCRSAMSLALWEHHVVQPAAQRHFNVPVARLEHFGSYACRNVYGREGDRRSQHATADALDIAGFVLGDGRRIRVRSGWNGDPGQSAFLHEVRTGACQVFDAVLSPDYNAAHHDHLHLDRGAFRVCS